MIEVLANNIKLTCSDAPMAKFFAFCIEKEVHSIHDYELDKKKYIEKIKSLSFNLKQNEVWRLLMNIKI